MSFTIGRMGTQSVNLDVKRQCDHTLFSNLDVVVGC